MTEPLARGPSSIHRRPIGRATIGDQLRRHARTQPDKVAVVTHDAYGTRHPTTYAELDRAVNVMANAMLVRGLSRGDRVAMMSRNCVQYVVAYYAALKVGAAFTGINVMFRGHEVAYQVTHAEPTVLIVAQEFAPGVEDVRSELTSVSTFVVLGAARDGWETWEQLRAVVDEQEPPCEVDENDVAMMVYTSGTEAFPKGVVIPHRNYLISTAPAWSWGVDTTPQDTWLFVMPFHTIAGLGSMTTLTLMGATLVLPASADPSYSLRLIREEKITVIAQTPTFYLALCAQDEFGPEAVSTVRRCMTYGGLVARSAVEAWAEAGSAELMWGTYWGQSELSQLGSVGWFRTLADIPEGDPTFIGKPVSHLEIRVVDPAGSDAEVGELWCRSPSVMLGYYKDPERTEEVMRDGWVHTGDMVRVDAQGNLFFYDRIKDVVKSGGMNISSQEVERVVSEVAGVERVAVVGLPDDYWSEALTAFVVGQADPDAVIAHCKQRLAGFKVPKAVHMVESLPTDAQGKILKRELRRSPVAPTRPGA